MVKEIRRFGQRRSPETLAVPKVQTRVQDPSSNSFKARKDNLKVVSYLTYYILVI